MIWHYPQIAEIEPVAAFGLYGIAPTYTRTEVFLHKFPRYVRQQTVQTPASRYRSNK